MRELEDESFCPLKINKIKGATCRVHPEKASDAQINVYLVI